MSDAACRDADPEMFFPKTPHSRSTQLALAMCAECPVILECAQYRRSIKAGYGIWHGRLFSKKGKEAC
jgi:hypothetical protein